MDKYKNLKLFFTSSDNCGCGYYRTYLPHLFLKQHFDWVEHNFGFPPQDQRLEEADVIILQRATHEHFQQWIPYIKSKGKKIIFDLDDFLHGIPAANLAHRYYPRKELDKLTAVMKLSDVITVSTIPLKEELQKILPEKQIFVIPNHLFHNEMSEKPKNDKTKIVWAGSYTHNGDFDHHLVKSLRKIVEKYKDTVEFYTFGFLPQFFKGVSTHIDWADTLEYKDVLTQHNFDIGIIVAENNTFNKCKSNLKFLEYSSIKCTSIAHNTYPYATTIENNIDGHLIQNPKIDWLNYLEWHINNPKERLKMAERAYEKVKHQFTYEYDLDLIKKYREVFDFLY